MPSKTLPNHIFVGEIKRALDEGRTATFRVKGYSMRPYLEHLRDKVVLAPASPDALKPGDVILAEVAERVYVLHRLVRRKGDCLTLKGDGNAFGTEHCRVQNVVGIATGFMRKGREEVEPLTTLKWRVYSYLWMHLDPMRRYLLALHRRVWLKLFPVRHLPEE